MHHRQEALLEDDLDFVDDDNEGGSIRSRVDQPRWKVLVIDDDAEVHAATRFALARQLFLGRRLEILGARSAMEGKALLQQHPDAAAILLDVVMEDHDAGLKYAKWVREAGYASVRIILRTGQPGYAPELDVVRNYDINDYRAKSELTQTRLVTSLTSAIRSFEQITTIERSRRGLELIVSSCSHLFQKRELSSFSQGVLMQIASLCGARGDGLVCVSHESDHAQPVIVSGVGTPAGFIGNNLAALPPANPLKAACAVAIETGLSMTTGPIILTVDANPDQRFVAALDHHEPLDSMDAALLKVFAANITVGFENVGLIGRLDRLAYWDDAVHLPNRNRLLQDLASLAPQNRRLALVRVLSYSEIVVAFGQETATTLMTQVAASLAHVRRDGQVYRYGEDTLAMTVSAASRDDVILSELPLRRFKVAGESLRVRFAVGFASLASDDPQQICDAAYTAMSLAQAQNEEIVRFDGAMTQAARRRISLIESLRQALDQEALDIVFQPIVDIETGAIVGAEALSRWRHDGQQVSPEEFIPLAEQTDLSLEIFALGVRRAAGWIRSSARRGAPLYVSVNLSTCDLDRADLPAFVAGLLDDIGLPPSALQIEITEQSLIQDFARSGQNLRALRELGCRIAIDDFGTGYSSLSYVGRLPVDVLKLDRQFVDGLGRETAAEAIAGLTLELARRLGLKVVAEGVETELQRTVLSKLGCKLAQGYLFGRPASIEDLENRFQLPQEG